MSVMSFLFGGVFLVSGGLSLLCGLGWLCSTLKLLRTGVRTTGEVVGHTTEHHRTEDGMRTYFHPIVTFEDADGVKQRIRMNVGSTSIDYPQGCPVRVLYDPRTPAGARIDCFTHLWLFPLALSALGVASVVVGLLVWEFGRTRNHVLVFAGGFTLGGALFTSIGIAVLCNSLNFFFRSVRVRGTIVGMTTRAVGEGCGLFPRGVEFEDDRGVKHHVPLMTCGTGGYQIGSRVTVRYRRDNPAEACVPRFAEMWIFPIMFIGLGLPLLILGVLFWIHMP